MRNMYKRFQMPHTLSMEHVRHASPLYVELNGLDKAALQPQRVTVFYNSSTPTETRITRCR
jgi:hypothetical protein